MPEVSPKEKKNELVLFIGSRLLAALEGAVGDGDPRVLRYEVLKNPEGFQNGLVTHLEKASSSLQRLLRSLLVSSPLEDFSVFVVLSNAQLRVYPSQSSQYFQSPRGISGHDVRAVVSQTRSVATLPLSEIILQTLPESFVVNDMPDIQNPMGLEASRLGVNLKIFTMRSQDFKNLSKVIEASELEVKDYFPSSLTLSEAVLNEREKKEGALIVELAEDHTQLILWDQNSLDARILPVGAGALSAQISARWGIGIYDAEKLREQYGSLEPRPQFGDELIPLLERNGKGSHPLRRQEFQEVFREQTQRWIEPLLSEADAFLAQRGLQHPHYVFAGKMAALNGFLEWMQESFSKDGRIGVARGMEGPPGLVMDSSLAAAAGMFHWLAFHESYRQKLLAPQGLLEKTYAYARDLFSMYF